MRSPTSVATLIAVFAVVGVSVEMVAGGVAAGGGGSDKVLRTDDEKCESVSTFVCANVGDWFVRVE